MRKILLSLFGFLNAEKSVIEKCPEKDIEVVRGSGGFIDSLSRENIKCPSWYQSWQGYERCYPQKEFDWCWDVRPYCSKVGWFALSIIQCLLLSEEKACEPENSDNRCWQPSWLNPFFKVKVRFTHFAVEEQSKFLQNWHGLTGTDVCIDSVRVAWANSTRVFCDESHQNSREFTFSDNKEYDPNLLGWFSWVELDAAEFAIRFSSRELGASGSASFVGFGLQGRCFIILSKKVQ